jgi:hypothetical protein
MCLVIGYSDSPLVSYWPVFFLKIFLCHVRVMFHKHTRLLTYFPIIYFLNIT